MRYFQRILIADSSEAFRADLARLLQSRYDLSFAGEGGLALELLRQLKPDLLVLDLMLPGMDGISLLHAAAAEGLCPAVLATTRFLNDYILESAEKLGVSYMMVKPCSIRAAADRIEDLALRQIGASALPGPEIAAANLLLALGIPTKLHGYAYLRCAIPEMARDPVQSITKELYPAVGRQCGASPMQVERSIRSAIASAWAHRDERIWLRYFPPDSGCAPVRPTNAAFISRLADRISQGERRPGSTSSGI